MNPKGQTTQGVVSQVPLQPAANQPKKSKKTLLIVIGAFLLLVIAGGIFAYVSTSKLTKDAEEFVGAITNKEFNKAYNYLSPQLKATHSLEDLKQALGTAPFNSSCKLEITSRESSASTSAGTTKKLAGDIKCNDASYPIELTFIDTNEGEKINAYNIKPAK